MRRVSKSFAEIRWTCVLVFLWEVSGSEQQSMVRQAICGWLVSSVRIIVFGT
jgi:hypothetical protein